MTDTENKRGSRWWRATAAITAVIGVTVTTVVWRVDRTSATTAAPTGFVHYQDRTDGFSFDHPNSWRTTTVPGGVLLTISGSNAVSLRRTDLDRPVDTSRLADLRAVTDAVIDSPEAHLGVLKAEATTVGGLPGVYYLYTFGTGADRGAHTHWFAFHGRAMYSLVFQALPDTGFAALAPDFDAVVNSFRVQA
ncbi:MAG TPA: PsbP-related protein [Sporichthyaceae bacterium]|jgi:hypothetical protein|nr:PsbP-related protein [Sporichthyaceae bacterium]